MAKIMSMSETHRYTELVGLVIKPFLNNVANLEIVFFSLFEMFE